MAPGARDAATSLAKTVRFVVAVIAIGTLAWLALSLPSRADVQRAVLPELITPETGADEISEEIALPAADAVEVRANEIWEISTRRLRSGCHRDDICGQLSVCRLVERRWQRSSIQHLIAGDSPSMVTFLFVHGNRTNAAQARESGLTLYHRLFARSSAGTPVRFVFWSWPSEQVSGPLRDARYKAALAENNGRYLAAVLKRFDPHVPVTLAGYSFGGRIVTGALQRMAAQQLGGDGAARDGTRRRPYRVVLLAAAIDNRWLLPRHPHGRALEMVEQMTCLYNSMDEALRFYRFIDPHSRPQALGYLGLPCRQCLGRLAERYRQENVCGYIGPKHSWYGYQGSRHVLWILREQTLLQSRVEVPAKTGGPNPKSEDALALLHAENPWGPDEEVDSQRYGIDAMME